MRLGFALLLFCLSAPSALWSQCSFVLRDTAFATNPELTPLLDPNTIFNNEISPGLGVTPTMASAGFVAAILNELGTVGVDAISYGTDDAVDADSYFIFTVSLDVNGRPGGAPRSDLAAESPREVESDLFSVSDKPLVGRKPRLRHKKGTDENSAPKNNKPPFLINPTGIPILGNTLGLHGIHGEPSFGANVSNIGGLDFRPAPSPSGKIYFSIDGFRNHASAGRVSPADILLYDPTAPVGNRISVRIDAGALLLDDTDETPGLFDDIDALSFHDGTLGTPLQSIGWFSLTRTSRLVLAPPTGAPATMSAVASAADICEFQVTLGGGVVSMSQRLLIAAEAMGMTSDADIDGISHIDPMNPSPASTPPEIVATLGSSIASPDWVRTPDGFDAIVDGVWLGPFGPGVPIPLGMALGAGDDRQFAAFGWIDQVLFGATDSITLDPAPGAPPPITPGAPVIGGPLMQTFAFTWTLPSPNPYAGIELRLNDDLAIMVGSVVTSHIVLDPPEAGVHELTVRGVDAGGLRSEPVTLTLEIEAGPPPPENLNASSRATSIEVTWTNPTTYTEIDVYVNGAPLGSPPSPTATTFSYTPARTGVYAIRLVGRDATGVSPGTEAIVLFNPPPSAPEFRRGDCNADGGCDIADAIFILGALFGSPALMPSCWDACDVNDDDVVNIADAVAKLNALFGSPPTSIPPPGTSCGPDPTTPIALECAAYSHCP